MIVFSNYPAGCCIELSSGEHQVGVFIQGLNQFVYYDSNLPKRFVLFNSLENLANFFYKTVFLPEQLSDIKLESRFKIKAYYFPEYELEKLPNQFSNDNFQCAIDFFKIGLMTDDMCLIEQIIKRLPVEILIEEKQNGLVLFYLAFSFSNHDAISLMMKVGFNINQCWPNGKTLFHVAMNKQDNTELITFLLDSGAQIDLPNEEGETVEGMLESASIEIRNIFEEKNFISSFAALSS